MTLVVLPLILLEVDDRTGLTMLLGVVVLLVLLLVVLGVLLVVSIVLDVDGRTGLTTLLRVVEELDVIMVVDEDVEDVSDTVVVNVVEVLIKFGDTVLTAPVVVVQLLV